MKIPGTNLMRGRGRIPLYSSPDELLDYFFEYIDDCKTENKTPNIAGCRRYCGLYGSILFEYERKEDYVNAFEFIKLVLEDETINCKSIDPSTKKLILQNKFNYSDKIDSNTTNTNITRTEEESNAILQRAIERIKLEEAEETKLLEDVTKM